MSRASNTHQTITTVNPQKNQIMNKTKICITTLEYPPDVGGVGESVHRIAKMLINSNYEVHVAVFRSKQRLVSDGSRRRASCTTTFQDGIFVHRIKSAVRDNITAIQDFLATFTFSSNACTKNIVLGCFMHFL